MLGYIIFVYIYIIHVLGLKTHLVSNDLEFIYPELATAHSISNLTHILKENWNEVCPYIEQH